jgi:hypothetical protein
LNRVRQEKIAAEVELKRLEEVRKKAEAFKKQKELLERKINLITELKKKQAVPVHILDQVSRNLPEFMWLDSMTANANAINIVGKATTYNAVSNLYDNLRASGQFSDVSSTGTAGTTSPQPDVPYAPARRRWPPIPALRGRPGPNRSADMLNAAVLDKSCHGRVGRRVVGILLPFPTQRKGEDPCDQVELED